MCSFFLTLKRGDSGGDLLIYENRWKAGMGNLQGSGGSTALVHTDPGYLVLLAAGNHFHEVTPVQGGERWTMGGFWAPAQHSDDILYWG